VDDHCELRDRRRERIERQSREPLVGLLDGLLLFGANGGKRAGREHGTGTI
jgi:hypothetical protein